MKPWTTVLCAAALAAALPAGAAIPAARAMKGYLSQRAGEYPLAVEHYKAAVAEDPASVELRLRLVRLLTLFGEMDQALAVLDAGLALHPDDGALLLSKAKTLIMSKRNPEATEAAQAAALHGAGSGAFELALRLLDAQGLNEKAQALARKWIEADPESPDAASQHAFLLEKGGKLPEAEKEYRRALSLKADHHPTLSFLARLVARRGEREEALRLYEASLVANPHDAEARLALAALYFETGQNLKAKEALAQAQSWIKGPPIQFLRMGLLYLEIGEPDAALKVIESISEEDRDERVWYFQGTALLGLDRFEDAVTAFERIAPESPIYPESLLRRSQALHAGGREEDARKLLAAWLAEKPKDADAALLLASILAAKESHAEVIALLTPLTEGDGKPDPRIFFALGVSHDKSGEWEKCAAAMRKVIELDPRHAHALNYLGYLYAERGQNLDEAETLVRKAIELLPNNGFILDSLGWVYFQQKRYAEAKATLTSAVELAPDDPVIWEHLGDTLVKLGEADAARRAYEKALVHQPEAAGPLRKLKELEGR